MDRKNLNLADEAGKTESKPTDTEADDTTTETPESSDQGGSEQEEANDPKLQAEKQIAAWKVKIESGKFSKDDAPVWVAKKLAELEEKEVSKLDQLLDKKLAEKELHSKFNEKKNKVMELGLELDKRKAIDAEFENLMKSGKFNELEALEYALFKNNVRLDQKANFRGSLNLSGSQSLQLEDNSAETPGERRKRLYKEVYG